MTFATGLSDTEVEAIGLHPNPNRGELTLDLSGLDLLTQDAEVTVFDLQGKAVFQSRTRMEQLPMDLSNQPAGTYLLRVRSGTRILSEKITKL